jgi:hypothetical protein
LATTVVDASHSSAWRLSLFTNAATATAATTCERNSFYVTLLFHGTEPFPTLRGL